MKVYSFLKNNYILLSILLIYGLIYSLVSLVNHYFFRTYAYDLGIYNNVLYDYSFFRVNDNTVMQTQFDNILSDHFSLYHFVFCHFRYLMGSWTLLIFQIISILFGAIGIYKLINLLSENKVFSYLATIHFLSFWGIFSALSFDYHDNVVASMFVPWLLYYLIKKDTLKTFIFLFIILIGKENMSMWTAFIFIGMILWYRKDKMIIKLSVVGCIISLVYFVLIIKYVMPALANEGAGYKHFNYGAMGNDMFDVAKNIVTKPIKAIKFLFVAENVHGSYKYIKFELHYMIILAGGIALIFRPQFLIMLIPIYFQKLYNIHFGKWGINDHYSIEYAPILTIALFILLFHIFKNKKVRYAISIFAIFLSISCLVYSLSFRKSRWYSIERNNFLISAHYQTKSNIDDFHHAIELIPDDADVCAQSIFVPRLAFRKNIYSFPKFHEKSDFILLSKNPDVTYPLSKKVYFSTLQSIRNDTTFFIKFENNEIVLFESKKSKY